MLIKIILIFMAAMVLVAMIGKALFPGRFSNLMTKRRKPAVCTRCGRPQIGRQRCDCGEQGK